MANQTSLVSARMNRARSPRIASRVAACLCLIAAPLAASTADPSAVPELSGEAYETVPFASQFEGVIEPLTQDLTGIDPAVPASAVDLDSFDPPIEGNTVVSNLGTGIASYYGRKFHGRRTASGEPFDMGAFTAAHRTLPFGSLVRVTNPRSGRSVTVRINDRGPFVRGRTIDVSRAAAQELGMIASGHAPVELELLAP